MADAQPSNPPSPRLGSLLEFAMDTIQEGVYLIDGEARFRYVNEEPCRKLGYTCDELLGMTVADLDPGYPMERWTEHWEELRSRGSLTFETSHRAKDGRLIPVEVNANYFESGGRSFNLALARDIRERRRTEEALRTLGAELQTIYDHTYTLFAYLDRDFNFIRVNRAYAEADGRPAAFFPGKNHFDLYPHAENEAIFRGVVETGRPYIVRAKPFEYKDYPERGTTYWDWTLVPVHDGDGKVAGLILTLLDVSEQQRAALALRRLNRELRAISACNQLVIRAESERGLLQEVCRIICDEAGYRFCWVGFAEQDEARTVAPMAWAGEEGGYLSRIQVTWADGPSGQGPTGTAIREGRTICRQEPDRATAGTLWSTLQRTLGYRASIALPLKDTEGRSFGALNIYSAEPEPFNPEEVHLLEELAGDLAFGITTLRGREEIKRRESFIQNVLESVDEGFVVLDDRFRIQSANRAFLAYAGLALDEVLGRPCFEVSHHLDRPCFEAGEDCPVLLTLQRGGSHSAVHSHPGPDGSIRHVEIRSYPIVDAEGRITSAIETHTDITDRRKLEEQLRQSQKMEAIGQLAGGVAHDFNNILQAILGYGTLARMCTDDGNPLRPLIDQILASSNRAARLTQGLLAFSRKQVLHPKPVDLNLIVRSVEQLLHRIIGEDVELATSLDESGLVLLADEGQLEQVLMNLATNARDAMPRGGTLTLSTSSRTLDADTATRLGLAGPGPCAMLAVSDTGVGMDAATRERIFEPFFTTKPPGKGTGLGMSIVYGIVKQHEGSIQVYSEPGRGTTFKLYFPVFGLPAAAPAAEPPMPRGGQETVLLAEDDADVRALTATVLREFGYEVLEAADGAEALETFKRDSGRVDLLVLDVIMPKLSGKSVHDAVKAIRPEAQVLFVSGYTADIIQKSGLIEANAEVLSKPLSPYDLLAKIREILDRRPA